MPTVSPPAATVLDLTQHRLERALRQRVRYRYVQPQVVRQGDGFRVQSPCCSRTVDPEGGLIDIALMAPCTLPLPTALEAGTSPPPESGWCLYAFDHARGQWVPQEQSAQIDTLLDLLCLDAQRIYWP